MSFLAEPRAEDARLGWQGVFARRLAEQGLATPPGFAVTNVLFRALCPGVPAFARLDPAAFATLDSLRAKLDASALARGLPRGAAGAPRRHRGNTLCGAIVLRQRGSSRPARRRRVRVVREQWLFPRWRRPSVGSLGSALAPGAVAYAMAHGQPPARDPVAVLVHAFRRARPKAARPSRPGAWQSLSSRFVAVSLPAEAKVALGRSVADLAGARGPTEIEWVFADGRVVFSAGTAIRTARRGPALGRLRRARRPDGRAGLVALGRGPQSLAALASTGRAGRAGGPQVLHRHSPARAGRYLFYAPDEVRCRRPSRPRTRKRSSPLCARRSRRAWPASGRNLISRRRWPCSSSPISPSSACCSRPCDRPTPICACFSKPIARPRWPCCPRCGLGLRPWPASGGTGGKDLLPWEPEHERARRLSRRYLADYLALFGDEAPIWDVCVPTYAEEPGAFLPQSTQRPVEAVLPDWQGASAQVEAMLPSHLREEWRQLLGVARTAVALGEADDWLYARTQAAVRRALLGLGKRLHEAGCLTRGLGCLLSAAASGA